MPSNYPSIFNDVIGPVMRGPSSSRCAAACRIGLLARDLMEGRFEEVVIQYDPKGSLAPTHESQGSDMGLFGGLIGVFICAGSTFAAEVCGCQAECGAGSGMAAAALVSLAHGTLPQTIAAASLALQNILGMVCDPVAGRVEVPCLGKNVLAAANALACANMALADFDPVIPLDEVIGAMDQVGRSLPHELRCTALGGLSVTKTSREIEKRLVGGSELKCNRVS